MILDVIKKGRDRVFATNSDFRIPHIFAMSYTYMFQTINSFRQKFEISGCKDIRIRKYPIAAKLSSFKDIRKLEMKTHLQLMGV